MTKKPRLCIAKIRTRRKPKVTQLELGGAAGLGQNSISRIERHIQSPRLDSLQKIADYLGVSFFELFEEYDRSEVEREFLDRLRALDEADRSQVVAYLRFLADQKKAG